jgi:succinoglycan biosynthesis protein ExoU
VQQALVETSIHRREIDAVSESRATAVIITAKDAASTIERAVSSALLQAVVAEVVVVDDGSSDGTSAAAKAADDGTGRLKIIRFDVNQGPAYGRNVAMDVSQSPFVCILDADDFLDRSRLETLFAKGGSDWDLLADDIVFARDYDVTGPRDYLLHNDYRLPMTLDLEQFAAGNIPRNDRYRRELGFLKPVIRRSFLQSNAIRYDERLRLGEDFLLYCWCLLKGAKFRVVDACGYFALERPMSLSGSHGTRAVEAMHTALLEFETAAIALGVRGPQLSRAVRDAGNRLALRNMLDAKKAGGLLAFAKEGSRSPASLPYVATQILRAKWNDAVTRLTGKSAALPNRNMPLGPET